MGSTDLSARIAAVRASLERLPRVRLAHLPTPLDPCPRLSAALAGPQLWIKRDDCTGLAFGGNKSRQLEFTLGDAVANGADVIIQGAASQSNHSRQLAAAAAKLGLTAHLVVKADKRSRPVQGNLLVDHLLGAVIHMVPPETRMTEAKERLAAKLRAAGRRPYVVGMGATRSLALAAAAYVNAFLEIVEAMLPQGGAPHWIYTTSQGGTQAGLLLGARLLGLDTRVVGINPMPPTHEAYEPPERIAALANMAAELLGFQEKVGEQEIVNLCDYVGAGYGVPSPAGLEALRLLASTEGIVLDPVYTSKGFAGLVDHIRKGRLRAGERVVFVHTGGTPALFAYAGELGIEAAAVADGAADSADFIER